MAETDRTAVPGQASRQVRWQAPGRINLIGEHTDYNDGFALPLAIPQACTAAVAAVADRSLTVTSAQFPGEVRLDVDGLEPRTGGWAGYVAGVVAALQARGVDVPGLRVHVDSTVPSGAGLSSSAALSCSVATAVDDLLGLGLSRADLLAVTRSAENDFVGAPTGGMDQLASLNCTADHALFCDMRTLDAEQVPLPLAAHGLALLVVDTRAEHRHADGAYRQRRQSCERAARILGVAALRDVTDLDAALAALPDDETGPYTRHVVTENRRVLDTVALLRAGRLAEIGPLLSASHASLRDDYRVTIDELDVAAAAAEAAGALGARMTGGGFGGAVIALVPADAVETVTTAVAKAFAEHGFAEPGAFTAVPAAGAHRM